ncbi:MAG: methionyl-tRNA formyltransferase [Mycoplasmoidaceae bacterium]
MVNKKVILFGTPFIAARCLQALIDKNINILFVVTKPDKYIGRDKKLVFSEVKKVAIENNIRILQPVNLLDIVEEIRISKPDLILTCAYGMIIPEEILYIPKYYSINVHASLLPKYRGGAPIHWALINGEKETGITLMYMSKGLDCGNIIKQFSLKIEIDDNLDKLFKKMEELAYNIIFNNLGILFDDNLTSTPQDESLVKFAPNISREDEKIDFNKSAIDIYNKVRGLSSNPGAFCYFGDKIIKIFEVEILNNHEYLNYSIDNKNCGEIIDNYKQLIVATSTFPIKITSLQISGKKRLYLEHIKLISSNFNKSDKFR